MFGMNEQASDTFRMQFPGAMTFIVHHQLEAELEDLESMCTRSIWQQNRFVELRAWKKTYDDIMRKRS